MQLNFCVLTQREKQIVRLISDGCPNKEIASILYVKPRTVEAHTTNIYRKLGVTANSNRNKRTKVAIEYLTWTKELPQPTFAEENLTVVVDFSSKGYSS
jgi:DNA-binding NarL/FixJ family response regulator